MAISLLLIWSIFATFGAIAVVFGKDLGRLLSIAFQATLPLMLLVIIVYKLPKFEDAWKIREETKKLSIASMIGIISWIAAKLILKNTPGTIEQNIVTVVHILVLTIPSYFAFLWVFNQFNLPIWFWDVKSFGLSHQTISSLFKHEEDSSKFGSHNRTDSINGTTTSSTMVDVINNFEIDLRFKDVFKDQQWLSLFARHLIHEFAIENLLFCIETHQFAQLMRGIISDGNPEKADLDLFKVTTTAPKSTIVWELEKKLKSVENEEDRLKQVCIAAITIFMKYIPGDSDFSINISSHVKSVLYAKFGYSRVYHNGDRTIYEQMIEQMNMNKLSTKDIIILFDDARIEVLTLMKNSFSRFKLSRECKARV